MVRAIRAGRVYAPGQVIEDGVVLLEGRRIARVGRWAEVELPEGAELIDVRPHAVAAGFIDLHVHGAAGGDFMDGTDAAFAAACGWHARGGTTALLATTCAAPLDDVCRVFERAAAWQQRARPEGARVLGAHMEGPFFNLQMRGCHLPEYVKSPTASDVDRVLDHRAVVRHLTLAPEIEGAQAAIARFAAAGISVAVAHSDATSDDVEAALDNGLRHVTHLYNAMSYYHRRGPLRLSGVVEMALLDDRLSAELIADGLHVNAHRLRLAVKAKGVDGLCLVTDAMRGAGMPDGLYPFGPPSGKQAVVRGGRAVMPEGTGFASSTIPMVRCVQVMVEQAGVPLADALAMASANPARVLGIAERKGSLRPGLDADLVVLDDALRVRLTVVEGDVVYRNDLP